MSREPAKRRSRTHVDSPCRMTKTLSLVTTPPFYLDSHPGPAAGAHGPSRLPRRAQMRGGARRPRARRTLCTLSARPRAPTKQVGPSRQPALELDELGEHDVRHGSNLIERGRRHGVVEVEEGQCAAAAALPAELHAGVVAAVRYAVSE